MSLNKNASRKKAALENAAWWNQPPHPLPIFRRNQSVSVFRGAGWSKAVVVSSSRDGCRVKLTQDQRTVTVYDARSIKPVG